MIAFPTNENLHILAAMLQLLHPTLKTCLLKKAWGLRVFVCVRGRGAGVLESVWRVHRVTSKLKERRDGLPCSLSLYPREVNGMSGLPFQELAFLESKGREYSPFRNSFPAPAPLKGGQEGGKEGTRCRRLEMHANMHGASLYCGEYARRCIVVLRRICTLHAALCAMHASCTWNYGRGAVGEVMRAHLL